MFSGRKKLFAFLLVPVVLFALAILTSCDLREELPTIEETLPVGYVERIAPRDFLRTMKGDVVRDMDWMRCFECNLDWEGLGDHLEQTLSKFSYTETTAEWLPVLTDAGSIPTEHASRIFKTYSSASGFGQIMAVNIKYLDSIGADYATTGDFLVIAAYDHIKAYK